MSLVLNILRSVPSKKEKLPLSVTHPELAKEADGWDASSVFVGFRRLNWVCNKQHHWNALVSARQRGDGCPYCSGRRVWPGFNDLKTTNPEIAFELLEGDGTAFSAGSHKIVSWKGKCGHIWTASIKDRALRNRGCPVCSGRKVVPGINDFKTLRPEIALEAYGWDPSLVSLNSGKTMSWQCQLGHIWQTRVADRARGSNCPYCLNDKVLEGFNDLLTTDPLLSSEAFGWNPNSVTRGSEKIRNWRCNLGHIWATSIDSRRSGNGCPFCAGKRLLKGFNDLKSKNPMVAFQADGWDPADEIAGSNKYKWWRCDKGHRWRARIADRTSQLTGCPTCSSGGFSPDEDGYLYFVKHDEWEMYQIGITNNLNKRLGQHKKLGWDVLEVRGPMDGHLTQQWETAMLRMLKAKGADLSNEKIAGKFDGYSEAWSIATFEVKTIKELMKLTEEFEANGKNEPR